jgi:hypothetical protein
MMSNELTPTDKEYLAELVSCSMDDLINEYWPHDVTTREVRNWISIMKKLGPQAADEAGQWEEEFDQKVADRKR